MGDELEVGAEVTSAEPRRVIRAMSVETSLLVDKLRFGRPGDVMTDEELFSACGKHTAPGEPGYPNLSAAIKHVRRNHGIVWQRVCHEGKIKCLSSEERLVAVESIHRQASRLAQRAREVSPAPGGLEGDERRRCLALIAKSYALQAVSRPQVTQLLVEHDRQSYKPGRLLELFGR